MSSSIVEYTDKPNCIVVLIRWLLMLIWLGFTVDDSLFPLSLSESGVGRSITRIDRINHSEMGAGVKDT